MSRLAKLFDELMSHLNGEENDLAAKFREDLVDLEISAADDSLWRSCLEGGGVDNWSWYSESLEEYWKTQEEDE